MSKKVHRHGLWPIPEATELQCIMKVLITNRVSRYLAWALIIGAALSVELPAYEDNTSTSQHMSLAPEFTHTNHTDWINSPPITLDSLRGEVVLIDFWTYGCWNCYRSFPWLNTVEEQYRNRGLVVIGVHSPEFDHERNRDNVIAKVKEFQLKNPIMLDNDFSYWQAMSNRYWPAYYLLDKQGRIRGTYVGEIHASSRKAHAIEAQIQRLLDEES